MNKTIILTQQKERKITKKVEPIVHIDIDKQRQIINSLYLDDNMMENKDAYMSELLKKWKGYAYQDKKNNIYHENFFITFDNLLGKLVSSKLKCFYCHNDCYVFYKQSYKENQWTLDRIDNNKGHSDGNTVLCCLKCNLSRGNIDHERFAQSKKINQIRKID